MIQRVFKHTIYLAALVLAALLIYSCGGDEKEPVRPTFTSLWDNVFFDCGLACHNPAGEASMGPDMSDKAQFLTNLVSVSTSGFAWTNVNCTQSIIEPGNANQSTLAAELIQSISDGIGCVTEYNLHNLRNIAITDPKTAAALVQWINEGAQNN